MGLVGRQAAERAEVDVVVQALHVRVAVMEDVVLEAPDVGAAAEEVEHRPHGAVHPLGARARAVVAVMAHIEAEGRDGQPQRDGQGSSLPRMLADTSMPA